MNFNDNKKKWALTGVLLAVLGFNISPPKSMKSFTLTDMASSAEATSTRFSNDGSEYLADIRQSGDDLIVNVGKLQKTESGAMVLCTKDCGRTLLLPNAVGTKTEDIKLLLQKAMSESQEIEVAKSDRGSERVKAVREEKSDKKSAKADKSDKAKSDKADATAKLMAAVETCKDENEATAEITQCISDETISIFEDTDRKQIDSAKFTSILTKEMILPLGEELSNIRDNEQYSYANRNMMMAKMKQILTPLSSLINNASVSKTQTAKDIQERYNLLVKATLQDAKAAWDSKDLSSFQYRSDDLKMWSSYMAGSNIYNKGMNEASQMSVNLQNQIATSLCAMTNPAGSCGATTGNDQVIQVNGQVYTRVDVASNRGGATGQMNTGNVSAVPQVILQQPAQNGSAIVVPTVQGNQYNSLQPMSATTVNGVPMQVMQQQVVPSTSAYYQQPQQMYSQPMSQYSVPQTSGGVVNMGGLRTGGTTTGGVVNMGGTRY
ncbi:hypothetical protein B9G69_001295 [Bdellovibrio sp. SKB1291214]|uniref:hypothetical protein n=1 Tax=Bdellovibrio sp. SKB1291214 TaxID=1732569 RepID=UPI000B51A2B3|nr:hypothetical protein [Bdellovibrio sp. SKB1291214]UYL09211.1 hypothetical protein B9G69_001295 [Bdellovibrio sp. SKB1291214]